MGIQRKMGQPINKAALPKGLHPCQGYNVSRNLQGHQQQVMNQRLSRQVRISNEKCEQNAQRRCQKRTACIYNNCIGNNPVKGRIP